MEASELQEIAKNTTFEVAFFFVPFVGDVAVGS
jgi:hypothetical protein